MMAGTNIAITPVLYKEDIVTKEVTVKAASEIDARKGHLVFMTDTDGKYTANALETSLIPTAETDESPKGAVAVLFEDVKLSTSETTARVIIAGTVYYDMVREAGIDETACPDWVLDMYSAKQTQILFLGREE